MAPSPRTKGHNLGQDCSSLSSRHLLSSLVIPEGGRPDAHPVEDCWVPSHGPHSLPRAAGPWPAPLRLRPVQLSGYPGHAALTPWPLCLSTQPQNTVLSMVPHEPVCAGVSLEHCTLQECQSLRRAGLSSLFAESVGTCCLLHACHCTEGLLGLDVYQGSGHTPEEVWK